jgi:ADP-ribosylglycohydrolase/fructose-1,6-bisphosphatase/inositol monophosphatase family enzyme
VFEGYARALEVAVAAAREAGETLRREFHRPGGPLGTDPRHAPIDDVAQRIIFERLNAAFPDWGFRGEEEVTPRRPAGGSPPHVWVVDPNDGTQSFLNGWRGSAISIALLREGEPALGVVHAYTAPDDAGDLFAWAEGCGPLRRNGLPIAPLSRATSLAPEHVVLVSLGAERKVRANAAFVEPARFRRLPSIAYRLALVAAGDAVAGVGLFGPQDWDYAGGHALLRGAGARFVDQDGDEVRYSVDGVSQVRGCFGGAPAVVEVLRQRPWSEMRDHPPDLLTDLERAYPLVRPASGRVIDEPGLLARAQGCLLGQVAGDSLGSQVEFRSPGEIRARFPEGLQHLRDGGTWDTLAGQPTDDSELGLILARVIADRGRYDPEAVARAYVAWYDSSPFDVGGTIGAALEPASGAERRGGQAMAAALAAASRSSQANGSLMRISPLAIWGHRLPPDDLADLARTDSRLTHPHPAGQEACAIFTVAIAGAMATGAKPDELYAWTADWAAKNCREPAVVARLKAAANAPPASYLDHAGWVLTALQNAFFQLLHAPNAAEGIARSAEAGGDTDTNAAIAGALLGAVHGRDAIPGQWRRMVLTCRPLAGLPGVHQPRPRPFWPVDALELAERLLTSHAD